MRSLVVIFFSIIMMILPASYLIKGLDTRPKTGVIGNTVGSALSGYEIVYCVLIFLAGLLNLIVGIYRYSKRKK